MTENIRLKRLERLALQRASEIVLYELADPRLTFVTLTRVELSNDLSHGVIFWSTLGEGGARSKVEHALRDATPHVQSGVAKVFRTRRSPHLVFRFDPSIAGAIRVSSILEGIRQEREAREGPGSPEEE
jgi:ribosome-binding factor A